MSTALAVVGTALATSRLDELTETANRESAICEAAGTEWFIHAILCGNALNEAFELVPHGEWLSWLATNFRRNQTTSNVYRNVALHEDVLRQNGITSVYGACRYLYDHHLGRGHNPHPRAVSSGDEAEMKKLHRAGMSTRELGSLYGVSKETARVVVVPGARAKSLAARHKSSRKGREAIRALKREATRKAAKVAGGAINTLYVDAERTQDIIGQAHREATDPVARKALVRVGELHRQLRDEIVRALGAS